jgi:hypothetical protein
LGAFIFFGKAEKNKPGFPGLRYRSGPACGVAASHPCNPWREKGNSRLTAALRDFGL